MATSKTLEWLSPLSSPVALVKSVLFSPKELALLFINLTKFSMEPKILIARALAASPPEGNNKAYKRSRWFRNYWYLY